MRQHTMNTPKSRQTGCGLTSISNEVNEDDIFFAPDEQMGSIEKSALTPWKIMIVDDDANVHETTVHALSNVKIHGRPLEFLHAYTAKEARSLMLFHPDTSLILLDVVMETVDAGLKLVGVIREELCRGDVRIILRTGQPGYAKENMMESHRVDGYITKSRLTRNVLIAVLNDALVSADKPSLAQ
jgi:CheY-like chemotaxis protein